LSWWAASPEAADIFLGILPATPEGGLQLIDWWDRLPRPSGLRPGKAQKKGRKNPSLSYLAV